jgi:putative SOS response-associated peptidase YedK
MRLRWDVVGHIVDCAFRRHVIGAPYPHSDDLNDVWPCSTVLRLSEIKIKLKFAPDAAAPNFEADWNEPPTAPMLVAIRSENGKRIPKMMKWGLIPHWSQDDKLQYSTFNARSEDFRTKPSFREPWKWGQRCLVVTDGFYQGKKLDPKEKRSSPTQ